jgi:hypothetical protein
LPEFCGKPIAPGRIAARERGCESAPLAADAENQRELHVGLTDNTDGQKRSKNGVLRETFMIAGISNLSTNAANWYSSFEKPFVSYRTEEVVLCKGLCLRRSGAIFFELWMTCNAEKISGGDLGKTKSLEKPLDSQLKVFFLTCQSCRLHRHVLRAELFPASGKFLRQKHHDLTGKFGVWHVMCSCIPISCRKMNFGLRMAHFCAQHLCSS